MALRILHLADLHLGWEPRFLPESARTAWQAERDRRLAEAARYARDRSNGIGLVVIAGDLFEHYDPPESLVRSTVDELAALEQAGIRVVTVPGNHDEITYPRSVYRMWADRWPGVLVSNPNPQALEPVDVGGQQVWLYSAAYTGGLTQAWPPLPELPPRRQADGWHLGVFHATVLDGREVSAGLSERSLPLRLGALQQAGYDYVALGHVHQHRVFRGEKAVAAYCGAPDGKDFNDPGTGSFTVVTLGDGVRVEQIPIHRRPVLNVELDVSRLRDEAEVVRAVVQQAGLERSPRPLLRLRLTGVPAGVFKMAAIEEELSKFCLHVELEDRTQAIDDGRLQEMAAEPTVRGLLVRRMRDEIARAADEAARRRLARALKLALTALEGSS